MSYIKKEPIIEFITKGLNNSDKTKAFGYDAIEILTEIEHMTTVDVAEVKHGKWRHIGGDEWCCTNCGEVITTEGSWETPTKKYCHECGAKMNGKNI